MKKLLLIAGFLYSTSALFAQNVEVTPLFGYTFCDGFETYYGSYDVKGSMLYGARLDVEIADLSYFELSVRRNDPTISYLSAGDNASRDFSSGVAHYMVGYLREFQAGAIKPYGVFSAGTSRYWVKEQEGVDENYNKWFFSTELGLGAKMFISDMIGVRLQASVTTPWDFAGGGLYMGVGGGGAGAGGAMTFGIPVGHWDLSAGLIIRLKN
ncbi:MAG TPA: hypothetical protein VLQ91_21055 [Draconibacterium sp.]|nr:hypothetical protein [Draconibacterium sp.]